MKFALIARWLSPLGLSLTVLGNAEGLFKLADWANLLVRKWEVLINAFWSAALFWLPFTLSPVAAQLLTIYLLLFIPALVSRLRHGPWTTFVDAEKKTLSPDSKAQGYYVPAILLIAIPAYVAIVAPDVLTWMRGPDCPWEWGRVCVNPAFNVFGIRWLDILIFLTLYVAAIIVVITLGHPKRVFGHLMYGLLIAVVVIALSELSKLGIAVPNPSEIN